MIISPWTLYWITRLDAVGGLACALTVAGAVVVGIIAFLLIVNSGMPEQIKLEENQRVLLGRILKWCAPVLVTSVLALVFVPSTKEMAVITVVPAIANSEKVQKEATELYDLAKDYLKKTLNTEKPEKK
jgi:hypothetical protein